MCVRQTLTHSKRTRQARDSSQKFSARRRRRFLIVPTISLIETERGTESDLQIIHCTDHTPPHHIAQKNIVIKCKDDPSVVF